MHIRLVDELKRLYRIVARIWLFIRRYKAIIILAVFLAYRIFNFKPDPSKRTGKLIIVAYCLYLLLIFILYSIFGGMES